MKTLVIMGRKWRDKVNGNTYHSARAIADGKLVAVAPFQYGYGDQWVWSIQGALKVAGLLPGLQENGNGSTESLWRWCERNGVALVQDSADCNKRECVEYGRM